VERLEIKMIRLWLIPIIATVFFLASCATAPIEEEMATTDIKKCPMELTMEEWITDTTERNPLIPTKHSILKGDKVTIFMAAFNATPPTSSYDPDTIVIFVASTDPNAVVGFVKGDCMLSAHAYPLGAVASWIKGRPISMPTQPTPSAEKTI